MVPRAARVADVVCEPDDAAEPFVLTADFAVVFLAALLGAFLAAGFVAVLAAGFVAILRDVPVDAAAVEPTKDS